jgi:hypothetical protein
MAYDIATILLAAVGAMGIGFTWYLKVRPQGEELNVWKLVQSGIFGAVSGVILVVMGITVSESSVMNIMVTTGMASFIGNPTELYVLIVGIATALLGGTGGMIIENIWKALGLKTIAKATTPVVYATATVATTSSGPSNSWSPGFTVTPVEQKGVSPFAAMLSIVAGRDQNGAQCNVTVDWMDGSPLETFKPDGLGKVLVTHAYSYMQGTSQYTGHVFYPAFKVVSQGGAVLGEFNVEGKSCWIEVQSK